MVDSRIMSDKEYVNQWSAQIYSGKDYEAAQAEIPEMKEQQEDFSAAEIEEAANAKPLNVVSNNAVFKTPESEKNE